METPSSARRVTRSQTLAALNNNIPFSRKTEDCEKSVSKSRQKSTMQQQDRSALIDITNDSPIIGVAMESSSAITKQRTIRSRNKTPGSGEALLRCQVKKLLQKVEEEAVLSKRSLESGPYLHLQGFVNSPIRLLAPTPANTPQVLNLSDDGGVANNRLASPVIDEQLISQVVSDIFDGKIQESVDSEKNLTRSLLHDFSEKSETFSSSECSSVVTDQDQEGKKEDCKEKSRSSPDDDDSSVWSIQVNASVHDEGDDEVVEENDVEDYCDHNYEEKYNGGFHDGLCEDMSRIRMNNEKEKSGPDDDDSSVWSIQVNASVHDEGDDEVVEENDVEEYCDHNYEEKYDGGFLDGLCEDMSRIRMHNEKTTAKFTGRHTRFLYDSDDDEIFEEQTEANNSNNSANVLRFKGLPTSKGKHQRFAIEEDENDDCPAFC